MLKFIFWIILILLSGCMDYININSNLDSNYNFKPIIDNKHLSPSRSRLLHEVISIGEGCKGQSFKIPPIIDEDKLDRLYYLWFIDNNLVMDMSIVEPNLRNSAVINLNIDKSLINKIYNNSIPKEFFDKPHLVEFLVSDKPYTIPESRYIDEKPNSEKYHSDDAYWFIKFSDDPC